MAPQPPAQRSRLSLWRLIAVLGLALVVGLGAWLAMAPSRQDPHQPVSQEVEEYGRIALDHLAGGLHADGEVWDRARSDLEDASRTAASVEELHGAISAAALAAGGGHSTFAAPEQVEARQTQARTSFIAPRVSTDTGVTMIEVPAVNAADPALLEQYALTLADGAAAAAPRTCGWIVDLRGNIGGSMAPMLSGLVALLPDGEALSFRDRAGGSVAVTVHADGAGFGAPTASIGAQPKVPTPVIAVLQDEMTASSGEIVATAFRGLPGVRSFGTNTSGSTSGNAPLTLPDGAVLNLTTGGLVDRTGTYLGERPLTPVERTSRDRAEPAARQWLAEQGCPADRR